MTSNLVFRYQVESAPDEIAARADALLLEQTVELSRAATRDSWARENIIGEVLSIEAIGTRRYAVALAQPLRATALDPVQFLNVAFSNSSLQADVTLVAIEPPEEFMEWPAPPSRGVVSLGLTEGDGPCELQFWGSIWARTSAASSASMRPGL